MAHLIAVLNFLLHDWCVLIQWIARPLGWHTALVSMLTVGVDHCTVAFFGCLPAALQGGKLVGVDGVARDCRTLGPVVARLAAKSADRRGEQLVVLTLDLSVSEVCLDFVLNFSQFLHVCLVSLADVSALILDFKVCDV